MRFLWMLNLGQRTLDQEQGKLIAMQAASRNVHAVFVDRSQALLNCFTLAYGQDQKIDTYQDPQCFLNALSGYPRNTKIVLGYLFDHFDKNGIELAEQLHDLGFTQLCLCSGKIFPESQTFPIYLTV